MSHITSTIWFSMYDNIETMLIVTLTRSWYILWVVIVCYTKIYIFLEQENAEKSRPKFQQAE
jgi:hypothetical protein